MQDKIKAAICCLNSQYIHSSLAPWCLLAGVKERGNEHVLAEVIEGTINEPLEQVLERIVLFAPNVISFCCYIWNITAVLHLLPMLKQKLPHVMIVLGGPEVSYCAEKVLQNSLVDYVISGEGETPFAKLLEAIAEDLPIEKIEGLCYRKNHQLMISEPYTPCEIPPSPYTKEYFDALNGRIAYLETSRGCPYSCAFCLSGRCGGVRFYDLDRAKKEMLLLANSGTQTIKLVDRTFNANRKRANEIFRFIIDHYGKEIPNGICFHFEIAGDLLDAETLALLKEAPAGSMQFEIGLQSFHAKTLEQINRKTDVEKLKQNIAALLANGNAHIHIDLIAGLPFEDLSTFASSFNTAFALKPHMLQLGFLKLLHGSPMRESPEDYPCEYHRDPPYEVICTPWIFKEELNILHQTEHALEQLYNRGRFHRTMEYLLSCLQKTPFEMFRDFGSFYAQATCAKKSLDDFTALAFSYFSDMPEIDEVELRDHMVCDRLATNASGKLPKALQIADPNLKAAIKHLEKEEARKKSTKRGYALLYKDPSLVYVDYVEKHPVTGEYELKKYREKASD